jgi:hypothetical protein
MRYRGWLRQSVVVTGIFVLAVSMGPWWRTRWAVGGGSDVRYDALDVSAWRASVWWAVGLVLCVVAVVGWLSLDRVPPSRGRLRWVPFACCMAGLLVTVIRWVGIGPLGTGRGLGWTASDGASVGVGGVVRDELFVYHSSGLDMAPGWALYVGVAGMAVLSALLFCAALFRPDAQMAGAEPQA